MKTRLLLFFLIFYGELTVAGTIYSFEDGLVPAKFAARKGLLSVSQERSKLGTAALKWNWTAGDTLVAAPLSMNTSSIQQNGGINVWIYNEKVSSQSLIMWFGEYDYSTTRSCKLEVKLDFQGWRCVWARFRADMGHPGFTLRSMKWIAPSSGSDVIWIDFLEFVNEVSWERISDRQYTVKNPSSELEDFLAIRSLSSPAPVGEVTQQQRDAVRLIKQRIDDWHLGTGAYDSDPVFVLRKNAFYAYVQNALKRTSELNLQKQPDGTVRGPGLFPMDYYNTTVEGEAVRTFRDINERFLVQLAFDVRKNNSSSSRDLLTTILSWYYDQGWADGSGMGRLRFEMLRSSGFFHATYLMRDELPDPLFRQVMDAMNWYTLYGKVYQSERDPGESADQLRTQLLPKLFYALSLRDEKQQATDLKALVAYANNAVTPAPGYLDCLKPDYSGYHHRGAYFNAYYPDALYAASLLCYFLSGTEYQLSDESFGHLKKALLTFGFSCAGYDVPAGVTGRFPSQTLVLDKVLPAFAYLALSRETPDEELTAFFKKMWKPLEEPMKSMVSRARSDISFKNAPGEVEVMLKLAASTVKPATNSIGSRFMPYAGLHVSRGKNWVLSVKGMSKYIWDFESSSTENLYGRYLSYGFVELSMTASGKKGYAAEHPEWDWSHIPGTTVKYLTKEQLNSQNYPDLHRNFTDDAFLGGIAFDQRSSVVANSLHDNTFDKGFYARKAVFHFDSIYTFLGSGIQNADRNFFVHTTLFQNLLAFSGETVMVNSSPVASSLTSLLNPVIRDNYGNGYVVKNGLVDLTYSSSFVTAVINHGRVSTNGNYACHLVVGAGDTDLQLLTNAELSPVKIVRNDADVQVVAHPASDAVTAVVYNASVPVNYGWLYSLNIPGIIMTKEQGNEIEIAITNPDMNRPTASNISALSSAAIRHPGTPQYVELTLSGEFQPVASDAGVTIRTENKQTKMIVEQSTEGKTYRATLRFSPSGFRKPEKVNSAFCTVSSVGSGWKIHPHDVNQRYSFTLVSADGIEIDKKENCVDEAQIQAGKLPAGIYLLNVSSSESKQCVKLVR